MCSLGQGHADASLSAGKGFMGAPGRFHRLMQSVSQQTSDVARSPLCVSIINIYVALAAAAFIIRAPWICVCLETTNCGWSGFIFCLYFKEETPRVFSPASLNTKIWLCIRGIGLQTGFFFFFFWLYLKCRLQVVTMATSYCESSVCRRLPCIVSVALNNDLYASLYVWYYINTCRVDV